MQTTWKIRMNNLYDTFTNTNTNFTDNSSISGWKSIHNRAQTPTEAGVRCTGEQQGHQTENTSDKFCRLEITNNSTCRGWGSP
uniref:Uncharacterized protein n=1 Tax=Arundo donax TaxID=35708 RepID=A0A0A9D403_ARUDO